MRSENSLIRMEDGSFKLYPDLKFLTQNEDPQNRRGPVFVKLLVDGDDALCPVKSLEQYLQATSMSLCTNLFKHPVHLGKWNLAGKRLALVRKIKASQPHCCPRSHDIRKMSTSLAFFQDMSLTEILEKVGWRSRAVFRRHYLNNIYEVQHKCAALD